MYVGFILALQSERARAQAAVRPEGPCSRKRKERSRKNMKREDVARKAKEQPR